MRALHHNHQDAVRRRLPVRALIAVLLLAGCLGGADVEPRSIGDEAARPSADPPAAANATGPQEIARGEILATGPWTNVRSLAVLGAEGVDGFFFEAPEAGRTITTETASAAGAPYDLHFYFRDANNRYIAYTACATEAPDETCEVPESAAIGEVTGAAGAMLEVAVLLLPTA